MQAQLFFDDNKLFSKANALRRYGRPELIGEYVDPLVSTDFCTGWVFRLDDGRYRPTYLTLRLRFTENTAFYGCNAHVF